MYGLSRPNSGTIVVLNGFPGTGKLTVLKRVKALLPEDTTCLLDNHLLIDPVEAVVPGRSDEHHELRRMVRAPVFKKLSQRAREGHTILMTACLVEDNERDAAFLQEHLDMVRGIGVQLFWMNAHCERAALQQRLTSPERRQGTKTKLTDVGVLQELLRNHRLIEPAREVGELAKVVVGTLDVSGPVEVSANHLMNMVGFPQIPRSV